LKSFLCYSPLTLVDPSYRHVSPYILCCMYKVGYVRSTSTYIWIHKFFVCHRRYLIDLGNFISWMSDSFGLEQEQSDDEGPGPPLFMFRTGHVESEAEESSDDDMVEITDDDVQLNFDESFVIPDVSSCLLSVVSCVG